jgi:hypothetical protein
MFKKYPLPRLIGKGLFILWGLVKQVKTRDWL